MRTIFFRHGRTFEDGEESYDLGPNNNMPLTREGFRQADKAAAYIKRLKSEIIHAACGPMRRHRHFTDAIIENYTTRWELDELDELAVPPIFDYYKYHLIVTSNGILKHIHGPMKCGNYGIVEDGKVICWDVEP